MTAELPGGSGHPAANRVQLRSGSPGGRLASLQVGPGGPTLRNTCGPGLTKNRDPHPSSVAQDLLHVTVVDGHEPGSHHEHRLSLGDTARDYVDFRQSSGDRQERVLDCESMRELAPSCGRGLVAGPVTGNPEYRREKP